MFYVYVIQCGFDSYYKIGISDNVAERIKTLQIGCPFELILVMMCRLGSRTAATEAERQLHETLSSYCVRGEWFKLDQNQLSILQRDMIVNGE